METSGPPGGGSDAGAASSLCAIVQDHIDCAHQTLSLSDSSVMRTIAYAVPLGVPPVGGWPVVIYFQGSFVPGHDAFSANRSDAFGVFHLAETIKSLLDGGYMVIAPDAALDGSSFWQTNIPPYSVAWDGCRDDVFVRNIFDALAGGAFGPADGRRWYAMGISSGGFMTSRMAVSYRGRFRALADHSASYATCSSVCAVPTPLPSDHPPTLFLRGARDLVVPMGSLQPYLDALMAEGHETRLILDPAAGHEWLSEGVTAILAWFDAHP